VPPKAAIEKLLQGPVQACSDYRGTVVPCAYHPFVAAVHASFLDHRPLVLSPDMFWLLIAQGAAAHLNATARGGPKERIIVRRDDFVEGSPENPWAEVFPLFTDTIRKVMPDVHDAIVARFSTTGPVEKAANEIVLLDAVKSAFELEVYTLCGIPEVHLEGTAADWALVRDQARRLGKSLDAEWWMDWLLPSLDRVAKNAAGGDDAELWQSFYKWKDESGGPYITGWIVDFFPYRPERATRWSPHFTQSFSGLSTDELSTGLSAAPFRWMFLSKTVDMEFVAGFTGFTQDKATFAVRPRIGWAVREAPVATAPPDPSLPRVGVSLQSWGGPEDPYFYMLRGVDKIDPSPGLRVFIWEETSPGQIRGCEAVLEKFRIPFPWRARPVGPWYVGPPISP
jgi:hypothetical protein